MTDTDNGSPEEHEPRIERTVAFVADPRSTTFLLRETVSRLVGNLGLQRGLVDLSTLAGVSIALALEDEGVPYDLLDFGQNVPDDPHLEPASVPGEEVTMAEAPRLRGAAAGTLSTDLDRIGEIDANLMLIPAVREDGSVNAEFSAETLPGLALEQAERLGLRILVMCPPEQGVRRYQDGHWVRQIMHVTTEDAVGPRLSDT